MTVLVDTEIEALVESIDLIEEFDSNSLEGASYDMRLGPKYVFQGQVQTLIEDAPSLVLDPGAFVVLSTFELLHMPLDLIGHNGIMSPWAKRGLVSLFSPQIDPGFEGVLTVPVFNAGDAPVSLDLGVKIFTVEFARTSAPASYGWSQRHGIQSRVATGVTPAVSRPSLTDLFGVLQDTEAFQRQMTEMHKASTTKLAEVELEITTSIAHVASIERRFDDYREASGERRAILLASISIFVSVVAIIVTLAAH